MYALVGVVFFVRRLCLSWRGGPAVAVWPDSYIPVAERGGHGCQPDTVADRNCRPDTACSPSAGDGSWPAGAGLTQASAHIRPQAPLTLVMTDAFQPQAVINLINPQ